MDAPSADASAAAGDAALLKKRLSAAAELISLGDLAWLAAEAVRIEEIGHRLAAIETKPLAFAAMSIPALPSGT